MAQTKEMNMALSAYGLSDRGLVRQNNEDYWSSVPEYHLYLLADGMGGHQAGEVAAREAVTFFCMQFREHFEELLHPTLEEASTLLKTTLERTNKFVLEMSRSHDLLRGMGTTLCLLQFFGDRALFSHVGDSRIYRLRNHTLEQLTQDHSLLREMRDLGTAIDPSKTAVFKNIITKAVGTDESLDVTVHVQLLQPNDVYLLCSDGLSDCLNSQEIEQCLNQPHTVEERVRALIHAAKAKGGYDNITVVLISCSG